MQHRSRAIILKRVAYGEADWILTLFCREQGRVSAIARSARSSRKRFAGALEPGFIVDAQYTTTAAGRLSRLEEAVVALPMLGMMRSLARIEAVGRALALGLAFLQEGEANPAKFDLLLSRLMRLHQAEPDAYEGAMFELDWLTHCGFAPQIACCMQCARSLRTEARWVLDLDRGGVLCGICLPPGSSRLRLTPQAREGFSALATRLPECSLAPAVAATEVLSTYVDYVVGRPLAVHLGSLA